MSERCQEIELGRKCVLSDGHAEEHDFGWSAAGARPAPGEREQAQLTLRFTFNGPYAPTTDECKAALGAARRVLGNPIGAWWEADDAKPVGAALPGAAASGREDEAALRHAVQHTRKLLTYLAVHAPAISDPECPDEYERLMHDTLRAVNHALRARSSPRPGGQAAGEGVRSLAEFDAKYLPELAKTAEYEPMAERDRMWCKALLLEGAAVIQRVTDRFLTLRAAERTAASGDTGASHE